MNSKPGRLSGALAVVCVCGLIWPASAPAQQDVADIAHQDLRAGGDKDKRYFLVVAGDRLQVPPGGFGLVVVLPGGDGGADFLPFVKRIYKHALPKGYLLAQLVAVKWTAQQPIVWPTARNKVAGQRFATEQFIEAVVKDVGGKFRLGDRVFALGWSSSGPAVYAASLSTTKPVTGSFIAMSVFKPQFLGPLASARAHPYFLYHSREDRVCPFRMVKAAEQALTAAGAKVQLVEYGGGHGWRGPVYPNIRKGIAYLEKNRVLYLRPGLGLGAVRFGMSKEEVIALLGEPDKLEGVGGLNYIASRGYGLTVHPRAGVQSITCWSKAGYPPMFRAQIGQFAGVTTEGIGMGAAREAIVKAYGKPRRETKGDRPTLHYAKLGATFILSKGKLVQIALAKPG